MSDNVRVNIYTNLQKLDKSDTRSIDIFSCICKLLSLNLYVQQQISLHNINSENIAGALHRNV